MRRKASSWACFVLGACVGCAGTSTEAAPTTAATARVAPLPREPEGANVRLTIDDEVLEPTLETLGGSARGPGRVDETILRAFVAELVPRVERAAAPGHIDVANRTVVNDVPARALDPEVAYEVLHEGLLRGETSINVPVTLTPVDPPVAPSGLSLAEVLGEFTTPLSRRGGHRHRAHNVDLAAGKLHGVIIPAHGTISFNRVVGPRDRASGYRFAPVILDGELQQGIGGGICQAASTLHAAAFFGGLEFDEYQNHSRVSHYIDGGLDATVAWPDVDLVVRNPFDFPLFVTSGTTEDSVIVRIYGAARPRVVTWERTNRPGARPEVREVFDTNLPVGARVRQQAGHGGRTVDRTRRITEGERTWEEHERIVYSPVPEIVRVGTGPMR